MGMRCDQFVGLPPEAETFLKKEEIDPGFCEHCMRTLPKKLEVIGYYYGMFDDEYPLYRHQLKDGRHADEFLQTAPWSSGPVHFLGLKVSDAVTGQIFEWSSEEIDNC